jgi:transposase
MQPTLIAIDTSKHVFTLHGADERGRPVLRRELRRGAVERFFTQLAPTTVALEACGGAHHWGRVLQAMGHEVRMIPPQYVKPFVRRGKNDRIDAEAIAEAAQRPTVPTLPVRSAEQQAKAALLTVRELLVKQHTQLVNAARGIAAEFGVIAPKGAAGANRLAEQVAADASMPAEAQEAIGLLEAARHALETRLAGLDRRLAALHKAIPLSRLLEGVPGVGRLTALTAALTIDPARFRSGRHLAAWLGLTPRQHSTGGKPRLGQISRQGHERLRQLLVVGAMAVIKVARPGNKLASPWLLGLLARKPRKLAAVALANKMARILWAMMATGEAYRHAPTSA